MKTSPDNTLPQLLAHTKEEWIAVITNSKPNKPGDSEEDTANNVRKAAELGKNAILAA